MSEWEFIRSELHQLRPSSSEILRDSPTGVAALAIATIICFPLLWANPENVSHIDSRVELMHFAPRQHSGAALTLIKLLSYIVSSRILFNPY